MISHGVESLTVINNLMQIIIKLVAIAAMIVVPFGFVIGGALTLYKKHWRSNET